MAIDSKAIMELRRRTGVGMLDCRNALQTAEGNMDKAIEILKEKGLALAAKKADRSANEGIIFSYIHTTNKLGVLVELNCESDFVAKTNDFKELAKDIALQICGSNPEFVSIEDVPAETLKKVKDAIFEEMKDVLSKKPKEIADKIIEGKLDNAFYSQKCLLEQPFIKDQKGKTKVKDIITEKVAKLGENIKVGRFVRLQVGME